MVEDFLNFCFDMLLNLIGFRDYVVVPWQSKMVSNVFEVESFFFV